MEQVSTTRMSSKGQVVTPEDIHRRLELDPGTPFIVLSEDDVVILKMVRPPSMGDFDRLVKNAKKQARADGLTRAAVSRVIVSGDRHLLHVSGWAGPQVLRPQAFVEQSL